METITYRCKSCGTAFAEQDEQIDKCVKKRLYCDLCLAQKNPLSKTERNIRNRYLLGTTLAALFILVAFMVLNWEKNRYDSPVEYIMGFGLGYLVIWIFTTLLLLPVLVIMKKPHRARIRREKDLYVEEIVKKKELRKAQQEINTPAPGGRDDT